VLLLASSSAPTETRTGRFEKTFKVNAPVELDVDTGAGKVTVRVGDSSSVRVIGILRAVDMWSSERAARAIREVEANPPVEQKGNFIRVGHLFGELRKGIQVSFEISVPPETAVRAKTGLGDIVVEGVRRGVRADTGAGSLWLSGLKGEIWVETGLGDVEVRNAAGVVRVKSGAGSIKVEGIPGGTWRLDTGLGNVTVRMESTASFDLRAKTGLGSIHSRHPIEIRDALMSSEARGKVRGGGPLIDISTSAGSIHIE
jgi:DUF4097 and DUF4098 domain-containing protein YvlB